MINKAEKSMQTYQETVLRYRILRHEELPEGHKAAYRAEGIDPDDMWSLVWSFSDQNKALECLVEENEHKAAWQTYKMVDAGKAEAFTRSVMF